MKILIAEDTKDLNRVVTVMLTHAGYDVDSTFDGEEALSQIDKNGYDAVILDIMMPRRDGISVLKEMRKNNINIPVLLLTAKSEIDDRVEGLDAGADDYLPKPFAMKELLARVNALTRRHVKYSAKTMSFGDFKLDASTLELSAENSVRLSIKEYELLQLFVLHPGRELSTEYILEHVWQSAPEATADTVYLYVRYLRRKLSGVASSSSIEGGRGESYTLVYGA